MSRLCLVGNEALDVDVVIRDCFSLTFCFLFVYCRGITIDAAFGPLLFLGLNFMYVSFAFSKAGIIRGPVGLVVLVLITEHCCLLLVEVKKSMAESRAPGTASGPPPTFTDIARFCGGPLMENGINLALVLTQFGFCVGYLIFISQTVHDLFQSSFPVWCFIIVPLPILISLSLLSSIRSLGPWSLLANAALISGFVAVVTYIGKHFQWAPSSPSIYTFPLFFGQMTAALEGIGLVIPVESSMSNPARFPFVLRVALYVMAFLLMTVGVLGFATFGAETRSILLLNFGDSPVVVVVKCVLLVGILFTYPLQLVPVVQSLERWLIDDVASAAASRGEASADVASAFDAPEEEDIGSSYGSDSLTLPAGATSSAVGSANPEASSPLVMDRSSAVVRDPRRIIARITIVLGTALTAMLAGASFGLFQSLVGSIGGSTLAYTAPALFHLRTFKGSLTPFQRWKNWAIFVFGISGTLCGTAATVYEIAKVHASDASFTP